MNDLIKINLAKVFEVAFEEYAPQENRTVEGLYALYRQHLATAIACVAGGHRFSPAKPAQKRPGTDAKLAQSWPHRKGAGRLQWRHEILQHRRGWVRPGHRGGSFAALEQRIEREGVLTWGAASGRAPGLWPAWMVSAIAA